MHTVTTTQENPHVRKKKRKKERTRKKHMRTLIFRSQSVNFMDSTFSLVSNLCVMESY